MASEPDTSTSPEGDDGSLIPGDVPRLENSEAANQNSGGSLEESHREMARDIDTSPHASTMLEKAGFLLRWISALLFAHVLFEKRSRDNIRDAAERGKVVYLMQSRSLLDYLYFNDAFLEHDLPRAAFANGLSTAWLRGPLGWLRSRLWGPRPDRPEHLMQGLVEQDHAVFLFLEKPRREREENLEFSQKYLHRLVQAQTEIDEPIQVLPMLLVWEKRPDPKQATLLGDLFGTAQSPGFFRKILGYFQTFWQSFLKLGEPMVQVSSGVDLEEFLAEYPTAGTSDRAQLLRERLEEELRRERHAILGPTGDSFETTYRKMLGRPEVSETIASVAQSEDVEESEIRQRARDQLEEIAADPSLLTLKFFSAALSFVWYRIYEGFEVDQEGLEKVRKAARDSSVVLVPSHKSHIDYLVISWIFYNYGLTVPLIAAGRNLDFWPIGGLFRKAGAFFLRRSFKGEDLYPSVFREYLIQMLEQGYPIEFFIEGTRSRTGKLVKPKYGMVEMVVQAMTSGRLDSLKIVPISVGYEKIIEERSYREEQLGAEKQTEGLGQLLKTPKFLTSKYGRLYVQFADPIDLESYLETYDIDPTEPEDSDLDSLTVRLAHRINYDINKVSVVTASALVATVLLNDAERGTDRERFLQSVGFLIRFLTELEGEARLSRPLQDAIEEYPSRRQGPVAAADGPSALPPTDEILVGSAAAEVLDEAMSLFERNDQVDITQTGEDEFYNLSDEARLELAYYRNNIVHHFVPEALLAMAMHRFRTSPIDMEALKEETQFLSRLFKYEWIYEERAEFENVFFRTLEKFRAAGWADFELSDRQEEGGSVDIQRPPPVELRFFRRMILSFLESYAIVAAEMTERQEGEYAREDLVEAALERGKKDYLRGRIIHYESLSKPTFKNALRLLEDWGMLDRVKDGKSVVYAMNAPWRGERCREFRRHLDDLVYGDRLLHAPTLGVGPAPDDSVAERQQDLKDVPEEQHD